MDKLQDANKKFGIKILRAATFKLKEDLKKDNKNKKKFNSSKKNLKKVEFLKINLIELYLYF